MASTDVTLGRFVKTNNELTITDKERASGMHVLGGTGTGKSTIAVSVARQDIENGHGIFFIDTDGDSINKLLPHIPQKRFDNGDVILLDLEELAKQTRYIGLNPVTLADADRTLQIFKIRWNIPPAYANLENTLRNVLLTLGHNKLTIKEIPDLLENALFRKRCVDRLPHTLVWDEVRKYWEEDYNTLPLTLQRERTNMIVNKVRQLLTIDQMLHALSQDSTTVKFREIMDNNKIVLLKLSPQAKGHDGVALGEDGVKFLGLFLMSELKNAFFSRADLPEDKRTFFSCFFDEWQLYITPDFKELLTRGRKYGCRAMVLNQTLEQLDKELQAIVRQLNIRVTFRVGEDDADEVSLRYAKDPPPGEMEYRPIYEPEYITRWEWDSAEAEQEYQKLLERRSELFDFVKLVKRCFVLCTNSMLEVAYLDHSALSSTSLENLAETGSLEQVIGYCSSHMLEPCYDKTEGSVLESSVILEKESQLYKQFTEPFIERLSNFKFERYEMLKKVVREYRKEKMDISHYAEKRSIFRRKKEREIDQKNERLKKEFEERMRQFAQAWFERLPGKIEIPYPVALPTKIERILAREGGKYAEILLKVLQEPHVLSNGQNYPGLREIVKTIIFTITIEGYVIDLPEKAGINIRTERKPIPAIQAVFLDLLKQISLEFKANTERASRVHAEHYIQVTEQRTKTTSDGKTYLVWKAVHDKTISKSYSFSGGRGFMREEAILSGFTEKEIQLFHEKPGKPLRPYADMGNEVAVKLAGLENYAAYVAIGSRGDRFKHLIKIDDLPKASAGLLPALRKQALENAYPYTTTITDIEQQVLKRHQRLKMAPSPVAEAPKEEKEYVSPVPLHIAKRRVSPASAGGYLPSLTFGDGLSPTLQYLVLLYHFHYLTLKQFCQLMGKTKKSDETHVREDINEMVGKVVGKGLITKEQLTGKLNVKAGRVPLVYSLTDTGMKKLNDELGLSAGTRKGTFSEHTLQVNYALITLVLAVKLEPSIRLAGLQHERYFKQHSIQVGDKQFLEPDGFLHFQLSPPSGSANESVGVCLEIDLGSESPAQWQDKVQKYVDFASGIYQKQFGLNKPVKPLRETL